MSKNNSVKTTVFTLNGFIKEKVARIEDFSFHLNKRLLSVEKQHSYIKGGFYVFIATFSIILALSTIIK